MFVVPANTFDNVKGAFPIGFFIWKLGVKQIYDSKIADVFDSAGNFLQTKTIDCNDNVKLIGNWLTCIKKNKTFGMKLGMMNSGRNDFQNQNLINIQQNIGDEAHALTLTLTNLIEGLIFFSVRHCIPATWLNDRDQFLYLNAGWVGDREFQGDCLAYALFHGQNRISAVGGLANHWIPFTELEVDAKEEFASHFMSDFIKGKLGSAGLGSQLHLQSSSPTQQLLFSDFAAEGGSDYRLQVYDGSVAIVFSEAAEAVFASGRALWRYYHEQAGVDANASFYDIRRYFQGVSVSASGKERMNNDSKDEKYNLLIKDLREKMKALAGRIESKVYAYGFLKGV